MDNSFLDDYRLPEIKQPTPIPTHIMMNLDDQIQKRNYYHFSNPVSPQSGIQSPHGPQQYMSSQSPQARPAQSPSTFLFDDESVLSRNYNHNQYQIKNSSANTPIISPKNLDQAGAFDR